MKYWIIYWEEEEIGIITDAELLQKLERGIAEHNLEAIEIADAVAMDNHDVESLISELSVMYPED